MRTLIFISLLFLLPLSIWGEESYKDEDIIERITTLKGDVYEGFIQTQIIGKEIEFQSYVTIRTCAITPQVSIKEEFVKESNLSDKWKWTIEKGLTEYQTKEGNDGRGLTMCTFKYGDTSVSNVVIQERGDDFIRYIDIKERKAKIQYKDIKHVEYIQGQKNVSGLIDVIGINNDGKEFCGYITKQIVGKNIYIKEQNTNAVQEINMGDICAIKKRCKDDGFSTLELSRWTEVIETKSGLKYEGVIILKTYGKKNEDALMLVEKADKSIEVIRQLDVMSIKRRMNTKYVGNVYKCVTDSSCLTINGQKVAQTPFDDKKIDLKIEDLADRVTNIIVENSNESSVIVQRAYNENLDRIVAFRVSDTSDERFTYKEILDKSIQPKQIKIGNTLIDQFILPHGVYLFYVKGKEYVYAVRIKSKNK